MRRICSMLCAVVMMAGPAWAADALPAEGLVEILPVGDVLGDGSTTATLYVLALYPSGAPMEGLKLRADTSAGQAGDVVERGRGLYELVITPPMVSQPQTIKVSVHGRTVDRVTIDRTLEVAVHPSGGGRIQVTANPGAVVLGLDAQANISFQMPPGVDRPRPEDLVLRTSAGEMSALVDLGDGRYTARYTPPRVNYPHLAMFTVADARQPELIRGWGTIALQGKVDYPIKSTPNAAVILRLGEREFGPVTTAADGRASVSIVVPPGLGKATMITVAGGARAEEPIDLGIPEARRVMVFPISQGIPSDSRVVVPVRVLVLAADGTPDTNAALNLSVTAGKLGRPQHLGDGVYEAPYAPPDGRVQMVATIQATVPGGTVQSDAVEINLLPALPARVDLSSDPTVLAAAGTGLKVYAKVVAADGSGLSDRTVLLSVAGATPKGPVQDLKGGDYRADFSAAGATDAVVTAWVPPTAAGNGLRNVLVLPSAERLPADGVTSVPITVVTTDAWGYPVPQVVVELSVRAGGGALPSTVTTDARGMAEVFYTAGASPGLVVVQARSAGHVGAAGVVLAGLDVVPDLPPAGTVADVSVQRAWEALRAALIVPREGGAGSPVPVLPSAREVGELSALSVVVEPSVVAPGGTVTINIRAADASGRGVAGATLDLLASGGARFGVLTELGNGDYQTRLTVPADASGRIRVSVVDPGGQTSAILEIPVDASVATAATPWASGPDAWAEGTTPPPVVDQPGPVPKPPSRPPRSIERPFLRARLSALASSYQYQQEPSSQPGTLLSSSLAWGGDVGGAATPLGLEVSVRAFVPEVKYLGFNASLRWSRYEVDSAVFSDPAVDNLLAARVDVVPRIPIDIGGGELIFGARLGFRYDDFITFQGCTDPGCTVEFSTLGLPGLGAGLEIGGEFWKMYAVVAGTAGFAYGTQPYAANVDANLGWNVTRNFFVDLGFGWQLRDAELEGKDSGTVRGVIGDQQLLGTLGVGLSF